ncbi:MAG: hypothetical protein V4563_14405 [Pseudomonadota bacterium]
MPTQPTAQPGTHHPHEGHVPGDLDQHGHRDKSAPSLVEQPGVHHPHDGHKPGDLDPHGHRDTGDKK